MFVGLSKNTLSLKLQSYSIKDKNSVSASKRCKERGVASHKTEAVETVELILWRHIKLMLGRCRQMEKGTIAVFVLDTKHLGFDVLEFGEILIQHSGMKCNYFFKHKTARIFCKKVASPCRTIIMGMLLHCILLLSLFLRVLIM